MLHKLSLDSKYKCGYVTIYTKLEVLTCEAGGVMDPAGPGPGPSNATMGVCGC